MAETEEPQGIVLHGPGEVEEPKSSSSSAILLKLSDGIMQDLKKVSSTKEGLRFTTGNIPVRLSGLHVIVSIDAKEHCRNYE